MNSAKKIFLLIDDDTDDRELFAEAMNSLHPEVKFYMAENGQKGLDLLNNLSGVLPDVIFLDINMPVMNGWHCLKALKCNEKFKNIPVIMFSTSSHQREVDIAIDFGAECFCVKPEKFDTMKQILEMVNNHLGQNLRHALLNDHTHSFRFKKVSA